MLLPVCDGTPQLSQPPTATSSCPQSCDTSLLCQSGKEGHLGGLGKICVGMGTQLCVVRPAFLLCGIYAFNEYIFFPLIRGEALILLPELNVACTVTVSIKIKQKTNVYICNYSCGICTVEMYMWIKIEGRVPVCFGGVGQSSALCPAIQCPPSCLTLPPPWPLPPPPVVFSKVISTPVLPRLGGSLWGVGLSVCPSMCEAAPAALR